MNWILKADGMINLSKHFLFKGSNLNNRKILLYFVLIIFLFTGFLWSGPIEKKIPILCYHRFGSVVNDSMTIKIRAFDEQLAWLKSNGYTVISLDSAIKYLKGEFTSIPAKSVVITVDDGHKSVYYDMAPLVIKYRIPVTLFIYPSAISRATYAMTWEQLRKLEATSFFRVESHTYWHPNFKREKKKLSPDEYAKFVDKQLSGAKQILEEKMGHEIKYLAWAFGIYDNELEAKAIQSGYVAALTIDRAHASSSKKITSQPRYMVVSRHNMKAFEQMVSAEEAKEGKKGK